nr:hypothetical protein [Tanacetum cinerariifolium]
TKDSAVDAEKKTPEVDESDQVPRSEVESLLQQERQTININSTNSFNTVSSPVNTIRSLFVNVASQTPINVVGPSARSKENLVSGQDDKKKELEQEYILIPICTTGPLNSQGTKDSAVDAEKKTPEVDESDQVPRSEV